MIGHDGKRLMVCPAELTEILNTLTAMNEYEHQIWPFSSSGIGYYSILAFPSSKYKMIAGKASQGTDAGKGKSPTPWASCSPLVFRADLDLVTYSAHLR